MSNRPINRDEAERLLDSTFVQSVRFFDQIDSTNDAALTASISADELPALFIAAEQTAGRGRGPNRWISSNGALTFSLVISPATIRPDAACWPQLSLWTALGIRDAISSLVPSAEVPRADVQVKWPNDVYLQQKKVCGILIESRSTPSKNLLVVGIGINVNNEFANADRDDTANAIAIGQLCAGTRIADAAQAVLTHIDEAWGLFANHHSLLDHWPQHSLLAGRSIRWQKSTDSLDGICRGISDDGALLLQTPDSPQPIKCFGGTIGFDA